MPLDVVQPVPHVGDHPVDVEHRQHRLTLGELPEAGTLRSG
jgi:hypothetical protein